MLLYLLLLGSITTHLAATHKAEMLQDNAKSIALRQRHAAALQKLATIYDHPVGDATGLTGDRIRHHGATVLAQHAASKQSIGATVPHIPVTALAAAPAAAKEPYDLDSEDDIEPGEISDEPGAAAEEAEEEPGIEGTQEEEQEEQIPTEDHFFAPLFGEDAELQETAEKQVPPTPHSTPAKAKKPAAPKKAKKARKPKQAITTEQQKQALPAKKKAPAKATEPAPQRAAPELLVAMPVNIALQAFSINFTRAARASSFGTALATALHAEPNASIQSVDAALQLFFDAWATTLYNTSQTLVANVQTELSNGTGSWVGGFIYSCYNPAWRTGIEQQARNRLEQDIQASLKTAAAHAQQAAEKQQAGQAAAVKTMIAALHKHLAAHDAATHAPRAHQFVALAEQQQRSPASNIGRYIVLHRKQAAVLTAGVLLTLGYFWHRRRKKLQQDDY